MIEYIISPADDGLKTGSFLRKKGYSHQCLSSLRNSPGSLFRNGASCRMNEQLNTGDRLQIPIRETKKQELSPWDHPLDTLYEDRDIILVNKEAGLPTHPSRKDQTRTLANALIFYYQKKGLPYIFRCSSRLDTDTSGIMLLARHAISAGIIYNMTTHHEIKKEYICITKGQIYPPSGSINVPLSRKPGAVLEMIPDEKDGLSALTHYELISYLPGDLSLVKVWLETGRTHQIRVHMKYLGFPLIGDYLYNPGQNLISRQALHCHKLSFSHPITGQNMSFEAPLPYEFQKLTERIS